MGEKGRRCWREKAMGGGEGAEVVERLLADEWFVSRGCG